MQMNITIAILVSFMALAGFISFMVGQKQNKRDRFLSVITQKTEGGRESESGKGVSKQRADIAKKLKAAQEETQEKKKDKTSIRQLMQQAGIESTLPRYWLYSALFALFVLGVLTVATKWGLITKVLITFTAFLGIPKLYLKWKGGRRQRKFLEEFADALDAMVRLLQAGMPMSEAIAMASREFTGPLREEMTRIYENQKIGIPLGEAALQTARRVPLTEVHMFATALQIQSETGSSLSEVLTNLSNVIRARYRLKRKVRALSSEAKSSAAIIAALPVLVTLGLYAARPEYISILFVLPKGKFMLAAAGTWMSFGVLMMRQMINFRV
jgi:tight adherence protein B